MKKLVTIRKKHGFTQRELARRMGVTQSSLAQYETGARKPNIVRKRGDRMKFSGAMTPNEWRAAMNKAPLPGGDVPLLRKDTATVVEPATTAGEEE